MEVGTQAEGNQEGGEGEVEEEKGGGIDEEKDGERGEGV